MRLLIKEIMINYNKYLQKFPSNWFLNGKFLARYPIIIRFIRWTIGTYIKDHNYLTVAITVTIAPNYSSTDRNLPRREIDSD